MDALGNTPYIVVINYVNGDIEYYGPFKSRNRAERYGSQAFKDLKAKCYTVAELCRSYNDEGFDPV